MLILFLGSIVPTPAAAAPNPSRPLNVLALGAAAPFSQRVDRTTTPAAPPPVSGVRRARICVKRLGALKNEGYVSKTLFKDGSVIWTSSASEALIVEYDDSSPTYTLRMVVRIAARPLELRLTDIQNLTSPWAVLVARWDVLNPHVGTGSNA